jgi:hypothetical protein
MLQALKILLRLAAGLLMVAAATQMVAAWAYVMGPTRADPDPFIFVVLAVIMLGPSLILGIAIRRARLASLPWDFGSVGRRILIVVSSLVAAVLGLGGVYAIARLVTLAV